MFQVSVDETFSAGHALRGYQGKCENLHGHNYKVRIILEGQGLDRRPCHDQGVEGLMAEARPGPAPGT